MGRGEMGRGEMGIDWGRNGKGRSGKGRNGNKPICNVCMPALAVGSSHMHTNYVPEALKVSQIEKGTSSV